MELLSDHPFSLQGSSRNVEAAFSVVPYHAGDPETADALIKKALLGFPIGLSSVKNHQEAVDKPDKKT